MDNSNVVEPQNSKMKNGIVMYLEKKKEPEQSNTSPHICTIKSSFKVCNHTCT